MFQVTNITWTGTCRTSVGEIFGSRAQWTSTHGHSYWINQPQDYTKCNDPQTSRPQHDHAQRDYLRSESLQTFRLTFHEFHDLFFSSRVSIFEDDTGQWNFTSTLIFQRNNTNWLHSWVGVNNSLYFWRGHLLWTIRSAAKSKQNAQRLCANFSWPFVSQFCGSHIPALFRRTSRPLCDQW